MTNTVDDFYRNLLSDRYQIIEELSNKPGKRTILAHDLQTQEKVVIKLLLFGHGFTWNDFKLFEREAKILQSLSHQAIPQYLDYFELKSTSAEGFGLVQSYIEAPSLEEYLEGESSFSESEVKEIAKSLLEILEYIHGQQPPVIHRDIKPSNILITRNSEDNSIVYLVDFGSVQSATKQNIGTRTVVGTYGYMAPEQFSGRATPASDLYSLGATLIYLVTGQHPGDLPQEDLRIKFEDNANVSRSFSLWLKQLTEPILSKRLSSVEQALSSLEHPQSFNQEINKKSFNYPKPLDTRVNLKKSSNSLDILVPSVGLHHNKYIEMIPYIVPFFLGATLINSSLSLFDETSVLEMFFIGVSHLFSGCIMMLYSVSFFLLYLCGCMRIIIDKKHIKLTYEIKGIKFEPRTKCPSKNIFRIELYRHGKNKSLPHIKIWSGRRKFEISNHRCFSLTTPELDWLASELSDWLGLEVIEC